MIISLSIIHQWSPKSDSTPYPLLWWWNHLSFFIVQQLPNPTKIKWFKARCYRTLSYWLFNTFWLGQSKLDFIQCLRIQFLQLSTGHNLLDIYPLFLNDTQLPLSSISNTLGLSFTKDLSWQFHVFTFAESSSKKLDILLRLRQFSSPSQLLALYRGLIHLCME